MAPHFGQESRRPAHRIPEDEIVPADSISLGRPQAARNSITHDGSRARETQRKRDHQKRRSELKVGRRPSSTVPLRRPGPLADRETYDHGDSRKPYNDAPGLPPHFQQGRIIQQRITRDGAFSGDGGSVQPLSLPDDHEARAVLTDADTRDNTDMDTDDFADLFCPEQPPPRPPRQPMSTKPVQYGSSHHLPFNLHLHPARRVQPSTRREPIRMINTYTPRESSDDGPLPGADSELPSSTSSKAFVANKHPANSYKGRDPIKRRVQNKLLRCILADKPLPKPRKQADRMVLKCTGKQEFR